jgi:hypothetical protein
VDRPVRPEGDDTPPGYEDPYDYPDLPIEKRLFLAAHSDLGPEFLYGWGEGDGAYDTITGLLADDHWRNDIAIANTMGLVGDWGTDDVHEAVTNALHEYREMKAASAAPETSPTEAQILAAARALFDLHLTARVTQATCPGCGSGCRLTGIRLPTAWRRRWRCRPPSLPAPPHPSRPRSTEP